MATKQFFHSKRVSSITKVATGTGSYTVDVPFVPNFIDVVFHDQQHVATVDTLSWGMVAHVIPGSGYTLTVTYDVHEPREIRHVVAKLPVDPEQTIAH